MGDKTAIEWTDATWNPIRSRNKKTGKLGWHCEHVSEGCRGCYAERRNKNTFFGNGLEYKPAHRQSIENFLDEQTLVKPLHWKAPRTIFVCSMTDLFGEWVTDKQLDRIFAVMALSPQHTFQVLTKRPERMERYGRTKVVTSANYNGLVSIAAAMENLGFPTTPAELRKNWPLPNVWLGVSIEDQATADERIPLLLQTPAAIRFVSYEPALGPVDFERWLDPISLHCNSTGHVRHHVKSANIDYVQAQGENIVIPLCPSCGSPATAGTDTKLDWIIMGGESGAKARPMHPDWARQTRDQCAAAGVPFFFKQWGEWAPAIGLAVTHRWRRDGTFAVNEGEWRSGELGMHRVGKKRAGRLLDGREHSEFPVSENKVWTVTYYKMDTHEPAADIPPVSGISESEAHSLAHALTNYRRGIYGVATPGRPHACPHND